MSKGQLTTEGSIHILERNGYLLEKFELRGGAWVSLVDGRSMTPETADRLGWVYVQEQSP